MNVQVTDAERNLASFGKMVKQGNDVILSEKGSFIKNQKTGKVLNLNMENGCPQFDMWIQRADQFGKYGVLNVDGGADIKDSELNSSFQRLEKQI